MAANLFRLQKIKINVEYKGRNFSTEVQPYKTIRYIKEQAKNFFYPLPDNINIYYQNKDLTNYESNLIGDYFKKRTTVALRLLPLNPATAQAEYKQKLLNANMQSERFATYICPCNQEGINYYCRTCKDFICNSCRMSISHSKHNIVQVDTDNLEESAKLYAITLQADILHNVKSTQDYYIKFQNQNFIEASSRQEMFIRKLNRIQSIYSEMIKELSFNRTKTIEALLDNFKQQGKKAHLDLEAILTTIYQRYTKGRLRMSYEEMKEVYEEINQREKTFENESCDALAYKVNYEINTNIDTLYNRLDEIVDEVLNTKIPLSLNVNSFYTFEMIKNKNSKLVMHQGKEESKMKMGDEKKEDIKTDERVKKKDLKQVPTSSMQFKNRYVIESKDKVKDENAEDKDSKLNKEVSQKNIIADKGYDDCVNISENHDLIKEKEVEIEKVKDKEKEKEIQSNKRQDEINKKKESIEEDDLYDILAQNDLYQNEGNNNNMDNGNKVNNYNNKKQIDSDNRDDEPNDLLDSLNLV